MTVVHNILSPRPLYKHGDRGPHQYAVQSRTGDRDIYSAGKMQPLPVRFKPFSRYRCRRRLSQYNIIVVTMCRNIG